MFEKTYPFRSSGEPAKGADSTTDARAARVRSAELDAAGPGRERGGDALRAMAWSELTARLNAARDLRLELRHEARTNIESDPASFADAAASYFRNLGERKPEINSAALGQSKGSRGNSGGLDPAPDSHPEGEAGEPDGTLHEAMQEKSDD